MIEIREIHDPNEKEKICNDTLRALPSWFGMEEPIVDYVKQVQAMPFYAAFEDTAPIGFVAVKVHNPFAAEIYVMGIWKEYHRQGIGRRLVERCETFCQENRIEFLTVKTLDESHPSESYKKTREFYLAAGFKPLEVFPLLWDEYNPCLFMIKSIAK
jgi:GNAT superfamily N-acetyltransferase